jgi:hypothetical protein
MPRLDPGWPRNKGITRIGTPSRLADGWVMQGPLTGQTLAGSWPIPSILLAALARSLLWGRTRGRPSFCVSAARGALVDQQDAIRATREVLTISNHGL